MPPKANHVLRLFLLAWAACVGFIEQRLSKSPIKPFSGAAYVEPTPRAQGTQGTMKLLVKSVFRAPERLLRRWCKKSIRSVNIFEYARRFAAKYFVEGFSMFFGVFGETPSNKFSLLICF